MGCLRRAGPARTMKLSPRRLVGVICACLALLIACILIGLSVSIVPWNHLALVEDTIKPQVSHAHT